MKVSKTIRKIVALGIGATMMGATIFGATAADLKDYPTFFLDGGNFNGVIVVGGNGEDSLAAVDIAANMFYTPAGTTTTTTTTVEGDAWKVGTSSKFLEIANNNASDSSINGERIRDINTFIGDDELDALADGTWATNEQNYGFQQFLFFDEDPGTSRIVKYSEDDGDVTADHFFIASGRQIARYKLEFTSNAQSDITDSSGSATATGTYLDDFEDTTLSFMGKEYTVVQARRPGSSAQNSIKLVLMAGSTKDTLLEGETGTYTVGDTEYNVELTYVDTTTAKFKVNGETTNKLRDGETYKLADGSEIGVSEVLYQSYAGGIHSATFYVGAQKLELRDDGVSTVGGAYNLKVGSEDIDGTTVLITGSDTNTTFTVSTIEVNMTAEDDYFVGANDKLSAVIKAAGEENEVLFGNWDVEYKGLDASVATHDIGLRTSSSRKYKLDLFDGDNNKVSIPVAYAESATNVSLGEDTWSNALGSQKRLFVSERVNTTAIRKDDYFIITGGTAGAASDGSAKSYLLQYSGSDKASKTSPKIKFKNLGSGETLEYSHANSTTRATIKLGGYSFDVRADEGADPNTNDDFAINVSLNGDGNFNDEALKGGATVVFADYYGSQWNISQNVSTGDTSPALVSVVATVPDGNDYDNQAPTNIQLNITATTGPEVRAAVAAGANGLVLLTPSGETEVSYGYTTMGAFVKLTSPSGDPNELTVTYPEKQRLPQLYVTSGAVTSSSSSAAGTTRVTVVGATRLASEVTDVTAQNAIYVGGPCANSGSKAVMYTEQGKDVPADCAEGFTPGEAIIALYDVGDNVAMVVAGYTGADTRRAGSVLANLGKYTSKFKGTQVTVTGTTESDTEVEMVI